jgi:signal transduction histidine kinase
LPLAVEILMLETIRGCLFNVARHANARSVQVRILADEWRITAVVSDDGDGFDPASVPSGHHGLALMRQRVELARGRFRIDSRLGAGTTVEVEVPV